MGSNCNVSESGGSDQSHGVIDIYPLSCYYFGSKEALPFKDETLADRIQRMKSKYTYNLSLTMFAQLGLFCFH